MLRTQTRRKIKIVEQERIAHQEKVAALTTTIETNPELTRDDERYGTILCMLYRDIAPPHSVDTHCDGPGESKRIIGRHYFIKREGRYESYTSSLAGKTKKQLRDGLLAWVDAYGSNVDPHVPDIAHEQLRNYYLHASLNCHDDTVQAAFARALVKNKRGAFELMRDLSGSTQWIMTTNTTIPESHPAFDQTELEAMVQRKALMEQNARATHATVCGLEATALNTSIQFQLGFRNNEMRTYPKTNDLLCQFDSILRADDATSTSICDWMASHESKICGNYDTFTQIYRVFARDKYSIDGYDQVERTFIDFSEKHNFKAETERRARERARHTTFATTSHAATGGAAYPGPTAGTAARP